MRIRYLIILLILFGACTGDGNKTNRFEELSNPSKEEIHDNMIPIKDSMLSYCNHRYSFCLSYPASFHPMGESDNGDGQSFKTNDGNALISSYGGLVISEDEFNWNIETEYEKILESQTLISKEKSQNAFKVTYEEGNDIFYRETNYRKVNYYGVPDTKILNTLIISFPKEKYAQYQQYINLVQLEF
tara:strand:- start:3655 stop:4215 length:561 start_codon:yes stop_codon:yes gene_type:complete